MLRQATERGDDAGAWASACAAAGDERGRISLAQEEDRHRGNIARCSRIWLYVPARGLTSHYGRRE